MKNLTPLNISRKYPTDRNSIALISLNDEQYNNLKERHIEKINMELKHVRDKTIVACLTKCYNVLNATENKFTEMEENYY
ncbi:hypothetical protein FW781_00410 (plasmid) [Chryseobacterium panacisoli]|uniref:Uncharacterized protein n=1 Tax=Chryseobacterium panacisoli TaxID=1807141 RepID=A0A5D8ZU27_9FLAO|nr:hypothetical protein [Chryseobacterium panacisoli]TZF98428.1 hypothetical protein FW781_00410 [Chryseobacterium panacisoli]